MLRMETAKSLQCRFRHRFLCLHAYDSGNCLEIGEVGDLQRQKEMVERSVLTFKDVGSGKLALAVKLFPHCTTQKQSEMVSVTSRTFRDTLSLQFLCMVLKPSSVLLKSEAV